MSLARAWRRQLYGASSAALIVPLAMLAALVVFALGGGFRQVGVLGQIFAGPPAPGAAGGAVSVGAAGIGARSLPAVQTTRIGPAHAGSTPAGTRVRARPGVGGAPSGAVPVSRRGTRQTGGAIAPVRGVAPIVTTGGPVVARPAPPAPAPTGSAPSQPTPQPGPSPKPTTVDRVVKTITPITQQVPGPVGPAATQAVEAVGSAADNLLPSGASPPSGVKLP